MSEPPDPISDVFEQRCRPRQFEEVCVLAFDDACGTDGLSRDELAWFSVGINSKVRAGIRGFVFDLAQLNRHRPLERSLGLLVAFMPLVYRGGGCLNWLHGDRFVKEWRRLHLLGVPPANFETEGEAVEALKTAVKAERIRGDLPGRLTNCGVSLNQIANAAGVFEPVVRRIAAGQEKPSDAVAVLISSALDSLSTKSGPQQPDGATLKVLAGVSPDTIVLKKVCSIDGCTGVMHFHDRNQIATGPHTLEWPWYATWVCSQQSAHFEIVTKQEYQKIWRLRIERERQPTYPVAASHPKPKTPGLLRRAAHRIATLFGSKPKSQ